MKKLLTILLVLFSFTAMAQPCADEDTVRSNSVTLITATTARVNGSISHFTSGYTTLYLMYVRVGQTDTATTSGVSPLRNLTGLVPNTQYYYYYKTICVSGTNRQLGPYYFTTAVNTIQYATERSTVFPYVKTDSGFKAPRGDTSLYRAPNTTGSDIMFKTSDSTMYYYNGARWTPMAVDSAGMLALLNNKVDSVTVDSVTNRLYYWKQGVSYGYALPLDSAYVNGVAINDSTIRMYRLSGDSTEFILRGTAGGATGTVTSVATTANTGLLGGTITTSGTLYIDTLLISTRAWRQKGIDSVAALITGGSGSVTSVATNNGTGITGGTITTTGTLAIDTVNVISTKWYRQKAVDSLLTLIGAKPSGSGTTDYLARWTNSTTLGIGATRDDGTNVGIGVAPGTYKLNVNGSINAATSIYLPSSASTTGNIYKNGTKWLHNGGLAGSSLTNIYLGNNAGNDTALFYNVGIGQDALKLNNGYGNVAVGAYAMANSAGFDGGDLSSNGIAIGTEAMKDATGAHRPIAIGIVAGQWWNGSSVSNIAIGKTTAASNYGGVGSTYVGASIASLGTKDTADWNAIFGADAFGYLSKANGNSSNGALIAPLATTASYNTASGYHALSGLTTGDFNTAFGYYAGSGIVAGTNNVHIGRFADAYAGDYSNTFVLNSDASGSPRHLINGDFANRKVGFDRTLSELAAGSQKFQFNGSIYGTTTLKLGGLTNGAGHKAVRFNTTDSSFYLVDTTTGGGGTPGGSNTEVQFNNGGAFGGSANFTWNGTRMSTIAATIGSTLTPDATSPLTIDAASTNSTYLLQMGKNGNPAYFRVDKDGNITDIGGGAAPISNSGGKPYFSSGFVSPSWASSSEGNVILSTLGGSTLPWTLNASASTTDNLVSLRVMGNNATTKGDIMQWTDNSSNILSVVNKDGKIGAGVSSPTAYLHPKAGTATAGTAPIKLNTGTALTTPEDGAIEYHGSHIYFTIGSTRYQLDQQGGTNIYNSDGTLTGDRTVDGNGNDLTFTSSTGTPLFNVEYNKIILTSLNSNILMQGDSIILDAESHLIHIDSLLQSVAPTNKMVVWDSVGKKLYSQTIPSGGSGTVNSGTQYRLAYYATTGTAVSEAAAITASRALISDANGVPTHSATTATEISFVNGVTSAIQTQLDSKLTYSKAKALTFKF